MDFPIISDSGVCVIKRATNTCANAFGLNAMSSGSALSRLFHKISMFAFVAGMAVSTLAASWVFAAQRLGGESYQCTSYPIHRLPYRSEVSPFLAEFFSDLVQSYCSSHRVMTAKSCQDFAVITLWELQHRSAQNGTRARKEVKCSCRVMPETHNEYELVSHVARTQRV